MAFDFTTDQQAAIDSLDAVTPSTFANGGHVTQFPAKLNDVADVAEGIAAAADYVDGQADAAAHSAADAATHKASLSGTSTTSLAAGTGTKVFATQADKNFNQQDLVIYSAGTPSRRMLGKGTYSGTSLSVDVTNAEGSGTSADWVIVVAGKVGSAGTLAIGTVTALAPGSTPTAANVGTSTAAVINLGLPQGAMAGLAYRWNTATTLDSDPGAGKVKISSASSTDALFMFISETDDDGRAVAAIIGSWDDSTNTIKAQIRLFDPVTPANFVVYDITGDIIDQGGWRKVPIAHVDHGGTLTNNLRLYVQDARNGGLGATGAAGAAATISVGTVSTLPPGSNASVVNAGTPQAAVFNIGVPRGSAGATGPIVATKFAFETSTTDGAPATGGLRLNNAATSSATFAYISTTDADGNDISSWLSGLGSSTNPSDKGTAIIVPVDTPAGKLMYRVTGSTTSATGYYKVPIAHISGSVLPAAGASLGLDFSRSGSKGADGGGAGDVIGPASSTDGEFVRFDGTTGKLIKAGGAFTAATIPNVAAGGIAATTVQAALNELDTEKMNATNGSAQGLFEIAQAHSVLGDISPSQITSNQNNYAPTGFSTASVIRLDSDAARDITGLAAGTDGRSILFVNVGSFPITLKDENASSTAGNRFALYADLILQPKMAAWVWYDFTSSRWRGVKSNSAAEIPFTPAGTISATTVGGAITELDTEKATLASPAFTGAPTAPTASGGTNTTQIATTAFVTAAITAIDGGAPANLNTFDELAAAIGDDPAFASNNTAALALKAPLASPTFTGTFTVPTTIVFTGAGSIVKAGAHALTITTTGTSSVTFPTAGTLMTLGGAETVSGNKVFSGTVELPATISFTSQGSLVKSGNFALTLTATATSNATFPAGTSTLAALNLEDQTLSGGARVTWKAIGTASGTMTLDPGDRPGQTLTNNGAFTLAPGTNQGFYYLEITNGASAGAITTSGFGKVAGDAFTTTNGHKFLCIIVVTPASSYLIVQKFQA